MIIKLISQIIFIYQKTLSPDHNIFLKSAKYRCRFYPSCSDYAILALRQYGLLYGAMVSLKRVIRCNPFNAGGYDPIPSAPDFKNSI